MTLYKKIYNRIFPTIIALSALSVSASAAFYSVTGLSKLFAGASMQVLIMAGSLEVSKLVIASLLYRYWDDINKGLRFYLSLATIILVLITSVGIYGFLSAAYQDTANKSTILERQVQILETKKTRFQETLDYYNSEKEGITQSIETLREGLTNNQIQYIDKETGQLVTTTSSTNRRVIQTQLDEAIQRRDNVNNNIEALVDSVTTYEVKIIQAEQENQANAELGPLRYISELTGVEMNRVVNWLLLVIIFVFDPLAISLVVTANYAFLKLKEEEEQGEEDKEEQEKEKRERLLGEIMRLDQEDGLYDVDENDDNNETDEKTDDELLWDATLLDGFENNIYDETLSGDTSQDLYEPDSEMLYEDLTAELSSDLSDIDIEEDLIEGIKPTPIVTSTPEPTSTPTPTTEPPQPRRAGFLKVGDKVVNRNIRYRNVR